MTSRVPTDDSDDSTRPMLGWEQAMAALQRNLLQQQQQQQQQQNHNASLNQAAAAALAAGLTPPTSLTQGGLPPLWPYNLGGTSSGMVPPAAAAAAASLASLGNPANSYLNHLQTMHSQESLMTFQQNLLLLEQLQQQRQLLAANPHLLMAVAAAQSSSASSVSPQSQLTNTGQIHHHQHLLANPNLQIPANLLIQHQLQAQHLLNGVGSPKLDSIPTSNGNNIGNSAGSSSSSTSSHSSSSGLNNNNSLLTTVNSALTNQHQDSLVDQHFRRSLGEDYNQIMSAKADKINVGK